MLEGQTTFREMVREELKRCADGGATFSDLAECLSAINKRMGRMRLTRDFDYSESLRYCWELKRQVEQETAEAQATPTS